ncbi:DUF4326 domain-containing protein [Streptomyces sp. NBC_01716]|uniref:DUF4326 domain-containing protein n=1 Tax=Streptomyces sp. NBC_01716 TaxID=2975917 RepID=UPI002E343C06|nr:DUF4326 domain-containing protein [Streptomyces sp. NBC_01716]
MATYEIEFGALGGVRPVPPLTVRTTDPNVLNEAVVDHARPYITPALTELGRPELADCLFRTNRQRSMGQFLHLNFATGMAAEFLPARITTTPERIQRQRTKGWASNGARYVGRGTRYGNPNRIVRRADTGGWHVEHDNGGGVGTFPKAEAHRFAVDSYRAHLDAHPELVAAAREELRGRDLMCWCAPELACHVDVLLPLANAAAVAA